MKRAPGPKEAEVSARVCRYVDQEIAEEANVSDDTVFRYAVDQFGQEALEELQSMDGKPLPAYRDWWSEEKSVVSDDAYGDPRSGTFLNQRKCVDLRGQYEDLRSMIDELDRGLGTDDEKHFLNWLIISRRDELIEDAADGSIADWGE